MKLVPVFFLLLLSTEFLRSQSNFEGGLLVAGVTSQISGDGLGGWEKFGFACGGWVKMGFSEKWGLTMGINYITKGSKNPPDFKNNDYDVFTYKLNYVDVPILVTYRKGENPLQFTLGPCAGVLVKQKAVDNGADKSINPPFRDFDISGIAGIGWWLNKNWCVEIRGSSSIIPIRPAPEASQASRYYERGMHNQYLMLAFWYNL